MPHNYDCHSALLAAFEGLEAELLRVLDPISGIVHNQIDSKHGDSNGEDEEVSDKDGQAQERKDTAVVERRSPRT